MLQADVLTFQEFIVQEKHPLSIIHQAVLDFLQYRDDVVVFGAQAVNAYVSEPRMSQDIDLLALHASELADELRHYLNQQFHIAIRVREVVKGRGYRLYQVRKEGNRHLVDIRQVESLPLSQQIDNLLVMAPADLIASKVISYTRRRGQPKAGTDWRDLTMLLLQFPKLKQDAGLVRERLETNGAELTVLQSWQEIVTQEIYDADDEDEFFI
jgi:hypothetical protein